MKQTASDRKRWSRWLFWHKECRVFSAPMTVFFGGEHAVIAGGPAVVQNVPGLRVYASFGPSKGGLSITSWFTRGSVETWEREWRTRSKLESLVRTVCEALGFRKDLEIRVLATGIPYGGANLSGALSAVLAAGLMEKSGLLVPQDFERLRQLAPQDLARAFNARKYLVGGRMRRTSRTAGRQSPYFLLNQKDLLKLKSADRLATLYFVGWCLETDAHGGRASGYGPFAAMIHSRLPFVFYPQPRSDCAVEERKGHPNASVLAKLDFGPFDLAPLEPGADPDKPRLAREIVSKVAANLTTMKVAAFDLLPKAKKSLVPPYCWGVVYSGVPKDTAGRIADTLRMPSQRLQATRRLDLRRREIRVLPEGDERSIDSFRMFLVEDEDGADVLGIPRRRELIGLEIEVYDGIRRALVDRVITPAAQAMRRVGAALESWGLDWYAGKIIADAIYCAARPKCYSATAVKMTGGGGGGCLVFIAPPAARRRIEKVLRTLEKREKPFHGLKLLWLWDPCDGSWSVPGLEIHSRREHASLFVKR